MRRHQHQHHQDDQDSDSDSGLSLRPQPQASGAAINNHSASSVSWSVTQSQSRSIILLFTGLSSVLRAVTAWFSLFLPLWLALWVSRRCVITAVSLKTKACPIGHLNLCQPGPALMPPPTPAPLPSAAASIRHTVIHGVQAHVMYIPSPPPMRHYHYTSMHLKRRPAQRANRKSKLAFQIDATRISTTPTQVMTLRNVFMGPKLSMYS